MARALRTLTPTDEKRLFAGFAVQPFLAAGLTVVLYSYVYEGGRPPTGVSTAKAALAHGAYFGVAALLITIACAFPTVVWLVKRRPVPLVLALAFGLVVGNVPVVIAALRGGGGFRLHVLASVLGVAGAAVFWLISIRGHDFGR